MYTVLVQQGAESGDDTELLSTVWKGGQDKYKLSLMFEITSGSTSATSIAISTCYGINETMQDQNRPCNYDSVSYQSGGISEGTLTITADAVLGSTTIDVSGTTLHSSDVMLKVIAPNGNVVAIDQVTPSHNNYSVTIGVGGGQYGQDGMYTITAVQSSGSHYQPDKVYEMITASTEVEVVDGHVVPEFGTIAAMILAVAIVAIIAVSAKTKLSLVPRY